MFSSGLDRHKSNEEKTKVLERICDGIELCKEDILECIDNARDFTKDEFTERLRQIFECYQVSKLDVEKPFYEEALIASNIYNEDDVTLSIARYCFIEFTIVAEQIRLRNYSLDYVNSIPEKVLVYIKIYEKRHGTFVDGRYKEIFNILLNGKFHPTGNTLLLSHLIGIIFQMVCLISKDV